MVLVSSRCIIGADETPSTKKEFVRIWELVGTKRDTHSSTIYSAIPQEAMQELSRCKDLG
jgi:hypothetical protein